MKVHVRSPQHPLGDEVRAHVERRLALSLDRFSARVLRVTVHLVDVNGPRGGEDKACRIEARLRPSGTVFAQGFGMDLLAAVDVAVARTAASLARVLERSRGFGRRRVAATLEPDTPGAPPAPREEVDRRTERWHSGSLR